MIANKKIVIIGAGIAGPVMALQLKLAGADVQVFEAREAQMQEGVFLGITPNGLNILGRFVDLRLLRQDYTPGAMKFYNARGRQIAELPTDYQREKYGAETMQVKRADLNAYVCEAAARAGIPIYYGKKFVRLEESPGQVSAFFEDGSSVSADLLIACDGIFSRVRKQLFPGNKALRYTGVISTGGYAHIPRLSQPLDAIHMTFGERGFFAYSVSNKGEVWWFNNYPRPQEPRPQEMGKALENEIRQHLLDVHRNDDPLFSAIIRNSSELIAYPVYDIPALPQWHKGRVCLLGDAAHGISPHVGQGASLALEDTVVLASLLQKESRYETAFEKFQATRKGRVEKVIRTAQKAGKTKTKPNPVGVWLRDRLIGFFIRRQIKQLDWLYGWKYQ